MFNNIKKEKFSLRKYKNGRTDSKLIGAITILGIAMLAGGGTASANVSSGGQNETTLVSEFEKVSSSAKTTFTDDRNPAKKVTVDAVADIRYNRPAKANQNTGNADGTDSVKFKSNAMVNYLLEDDNSKLKDSKKVAGEEGTVSTPYDKKGIAYDTDGKDYRESTVEKTGTAIDEDTGKEAVIQANNKEYKWIRSEVVDANKATYEKTKFNDIEAPVSPEGMHNNLGEINYGKITGKVYLVEETSDGHYGKFVEASGVSSDEDAVAKWKNGQATAKDFTKENVTLKEGDTVLVMDRDTYAHGSGTRTVNTIEYRRKKIPAKPKYDYTEDFKRTEGIPGAPTYAFWNQEITGEFPTIGDDDRFGTADDEKVNFNNETVLYYNNITKNFPPGITGSNKYNFKNESLQEILEEMHAQIYGILEYFDRNVQNETDRKVLQARREELGQNIADTIKMIKQNQIKVSLESEKGLMFSQGNQEILKKLRNQIEGAQNVLSDLEITLGTSKETLKEYNQLKDVELTTKEVLKYSGKYGFASGVIKSYHKDKEEERYSDWEKVNPEVETREDSVYANKGAVTISDDLSNINVVNENSTTNETEFTKKNVKTKEETNYKVKEIITPIRAYKVMGEGETVVNHYYRLSTKLSDSPVKIENTKVGSVNVNYESESGEVLKSSEVVAGNVAYEKVKTYDVLSGSTKVGEEKITEKLEPTYDATTKRYKTILGDKTGFTYEYLGLKEGSAPEEGIINKEKTQVTYVYRLVTKEDPKPVEKEVVGSVVVKYVDAEGNEIKPAETLVKDAVLKTTYTYTTKSGDKVVSTRDVVKEFAVQDYNAKEKLVEKITTIDGKVYKYHGVYPVSTKFNNVIAETGKVVEGTTTVVYQYDYDIPVKPSWKVPSDAPKNEVPEYEGGVSPIEPPVQEIPEFKGGVLSAEPPVLEVPKYEGGVSSINPPVLEIPEFKGGVSSEKPPVLEIPEYKGGVPSERPTILEVPEYKGAFAEPIPNPKEQLQNLPTVEDLEERIVTLNTGNIKKSERLPNTGEVSSGVTNLGFISILAALVMSVRKRRKEK
ncbi:LPXTG cell wall anchor domain-containing protein [Gemella haemolysans]|uniref:SIALI-17 repeat-containing surface protein n=1 Tax=Gemella haemolysans TaxID=1379 RepID=UPI00232C1078|nr:SIALI-17 repeat-containing surface protein [Gemella haemolysans]MDB6213354.1 LPXTG cell wall anchor domain-containing protein [Gemella haemolysans]